jgi:protein-S-isoprenylcysteine O-methyltransferase Ste14
MPVSGAPEPGGLSGSGRNPLLLAAGRFFFKARNAVFPAVFLGLALASTPLVPRGPWRWDLALDLLGIAVALSGQALRAAVIGLAYIRRGGLAGKVHADKLVTTGLFAHSRNPLYVGNFLALLGFCLVHNSLLCYLAGIPFFAFAYLAIVVTEEDFLARRFGADYADYCRRVPRFLPRLAGLGETLGSMRFDWRRVVRKEYGSTFSGIAMILFLLSWDAYRIGSPGFPRLRAVSLAIAAALVPVYLLARWLKKSGRLGIAWGEELS